MDNLSWLFNEFPREGNLTEFSFIWKSEKGNSVKEDHGADRREGQRDFSSRAAFSAQHCQMEALPNTVS